MEKILFNKNNVFVYKQTEPENIGKGYKSFYGYYVIKNGEKLYGPSFGFQSIVPSKRILKEIVGILEHYNIFKMYG
jgi:hypothetical protein